MVRGLWAAAVVACTLGGVARAEEETSPEAVAAAPTLPSPTTAATPVTPAPKPKDTPEDGFPGTTRSDSGKAEEAAASSEPQIRVFGRVMARAGANERSEFQRTVDIEQARFGVEATFGMAEAVVEADLAKNVLMRDVYLRLRPIQELRIYGGRFKAPFMQRSLESSWDLPRIGRGLVEDYLVEEHQLGGRRMGVMVEGKFKKLNALRISGGLFQGAEDLDGNRVGEDAAARISVRPFRALTVAASGYATEIGSGLGAGRFAGGGDATVDLGAFSLTGEALVGRLAVGRFTSQTALARYDFALGSGWVIQPTVSLEGLQLRGEETGFAWGGAVGLNAILDDRVRLQVQTQRMQQPGDERPANDVAVQVGARF